MLRYSIVGIICLLAAGTTLAQSPHYPTKPAPEDEQEAARQSELAVVRRLAKENDDLKARLAGGGQDDRTPQQRLDERAAAVNGAVKAAKDERADLDQLRGRITELESQLKVATEKAEHNEWRADNLQKTTRAAVVDQEAARDALATANKEIKSLQEKIAAFEQADKQRQDAIAAQERAAETYAKERSANTLDLSTARVGNSGYLPERCRILQIHNASSLMVGDGNMSYFLDGVKTKGLVDDQPFTSDAKFKITGTRTYQTINGATRTCFVLEPK